MLKKYVQSINDNLITSCLKKMDKTGEFCISCRKMSSDQKHVKKRGGTFSRKQLTIIQQYLQTGELPSKESLLDISCLSNGQRQEVIKSDKNNKIVTEY
jgi:predicted metal-binding protein